MHRFTVNQQYLDFLTRMGFASEEALHPQQRKQLREAFYGAWGQCLLLQRQEIAILDEEAAIAELEGQMTETLDFWLTKLPHS